jgi:hypothetical protein
MKFFYKEVSDSKKSKQFFYRFYRVGRQKISTWYNRHTKTLRHVGLGGKNHLLEKGHVSWNRKGRW